jgi:hypothetical protein
MTTTPARTRRTDVITARPPVRKRLKTIGRWLIMIYCAIALYGAIGGKQAMLASLYFG